MAWDFDHGAFYEAVRDALRADATIQSYIPRVSNWVQIVADPLQPLEDEWKPPCIAVHDGGVLSKWDHSPDEVEIIIRCEIHCYTRIMKPHKPEIEMLGDAHNVGLFDLVNAALDVLKTNELGYVSIHPEVESISESERLEVNNQKTAHQVATIVWTKWHD